MAKAAESSWWTIVRLRRKLPSRAGGLSSAFGARWRVELVDYRPPSAQQSWRNVLRQSGENPKILKSVERQYIPDCILISTESNIWSYDACFSKWVLEYNQEYRKINTKKEEIEVNP